MVTVKFKKRVFFQDKMREINDTMMVSTSTYYELKQNDIVDNLNDPTTRQTKDLEAPEKKGSRKRRKK